MDYKNYNDYELIYMIRENDDTSKSILLRKYYPILVSIANEYYHKYKHYGCDYDDFLQEAYIAFFNSLVSFNENKNVLLYSYVVLCVRRKMMTFSKKISKGYKSFSYDDYDKINDIIDTKSNVYSYITDFESEKRLKKIILNLSFNDSAIVELRINGFSYKEISLLLEIPISTIEYKFRNFRQRYKKIFTDFII